MKNLFFSLSLFLLPFLALCQTDSIKTDHTYFRIKSENDAWATHNVSDRYFSNGFRLEYQPKQHIFNGRGFKKIFVTLPQKKYQKTKVGFVADIRMYTPEDLTPVVPNPGDRPYAGTLTGGLYGVSNDFETATRVTTEYQVGILGPSAGQKTIQTKWHEYLRKKNIRNPNIPMGWDSQIQNTLAINIRCEYEKNVFSPVKNIETISGFELNIGTITNYVALNTQVRLGLFNDYFYNSSGLKMREKGIIAPNRKTYYTENINRDFQVYFFAKPSIRFTLYNSLLEGSPLQNDKSNYVIPSDDLNRLYYNIEFGYALAFRRFSLMYSQQVRSPEFKTAKFSKWGAITLIVGMRGR